MKNGGLIREAGEILGTCGIFMSLMRGFGSLFFVGLIKIASAFADWDVGEQRNAEAAKGDVIAQ
jgi:hypothetical protein